MPLFSNELTIIQDSLLKIRDKIYRDYNELENLQSSYKGISQFITNTVDFIKKNLQNYFSYKKSNYDIIFYGDKIDEKNLKSNHRYFICPLCGKINLEHAIPYFAILISLQQKQKDGTFKTICGVIDNPITYETFSVEENSGSFYTLRNTKKVKISSNINLSNALIAIKNSANKDFVINCIKKYNHIMVTNCEILNICNVVIGKYNATILEKILPYQELALLLVKEAGGIIKELDDKTFIITSASLNLNH